MKQFKVLAIALFFALTSCSLIHQLKNNVSPKKQKYVVMLSMDGCRWDYPHRGDLPALVQFGEEGVKSEIVPSFPSKTFPNHYSMVTGLYPGSHGLVSNSFYDPETDRYYAIQNRKTVEDGSFYGGEPIWNTAVKQGQKAFSYYWVGSEADIQGMHPTRYKIYDQNDSFESRVDSVISWLALPESQRPNLITWYFHEPDGKGHHYGPDSPELNNTLVNLNGLIDDFLTKLAALPNADEINVIITSDHGMSPVSPDKVTFLDDFVDKAWIDTTLGYSPITQIYPKDNFVDSIFTHLSQSEHLKVYKRGEFPERYHYNSNPRIAPIFVEADSAWSLAWRRDFNPKYFSLGAHGMDPSNRDVHAIFYAKGPAFKSVYLHPVFENVNLYPLIAEILGLTPAPVDGKLENVKGMLKD
jgi:predicted AlkP superfamily pyrophosphatase or phosphodiesterase